MAKIIDSVGAGAALTQAQHDSNLESLHGVNTAVVAATYTVDIDDQGETIEFNRAGGVAVTLDDITTIQTAAHTADFSVTLLNVGSGDVVITPDTSDSFNTGVSTITLGTDGYVTLQTDSTGAIWNVINGGLTATAAELNITDGDTADSGITVASGDQVIVNDSGTMVQTDVDDLDTYFSQTTKTLTNKTIVDPAINDANGNELLEFFTATSALTNIKLGNAAAATNPFIQAAGEADRGITFFDSNSNELFGLAVGSSSATGYIAINNGISGATILATGSGSNYNITLTPKGTGVVDIAQGDLEVGSTPVYGLVLLDTPVLLASGSFNLLSWTQHDMSAGNGSAAATAGASKAILRVFVSIIETSAGNTGSSHVHIQKNGLAGASNDTNSVCYARATKDSGSSTNEQDRAVTEVTVNLDSNSDFEYQVVSTDVVAYSIYLAGYYV